ncbi:DUF1573 domain-containing protein [Bremerella cremea]|uniref:DUF1573 domain-containing protein n=1 Tax=Bremerella cremea TaxID=1031537 RepID=UPI0031E9EAA0
MSRFIPLVITLVTIVTLGAVFFLSSPSDPPSGKPDATKAIANHKPRTEATTATTDFKTKLAASSNPSSDAAPQSIPKKYPKAVTEETEFDFGVLPRFTQSSHTFLVKNEGDAPLKLEQGPSSCSCTLLGLESDEIAPGEQAEIKLEWTLKFKEGGFRQSATVYTNDPQRKEIEFVVFGLTETRFGLSEPSMVFSSVLVGQAGAFRECYLYSRTWKEMENVDFHVKTEIPGLKVEVLPLTESELAELDTRSACKVRVEVPKDLEAGHHVGQIVFTANDAEDTDKEVAETTLTVEVRVKQPGYRFYSPAIDGFGRIQLGKVDQATGSEVLKINFRVDQGAEPWEPSDVFRFPESMDVKIETIDEKIGLFQLQIQIPPGMPKGNYYGQHVGRIVISSDHSLIKRIPDGERAGILVEFHVE